MSVPLMKTRTPPGTPYWTTATKPGDCANCGSKIEPGAQVLYFPSYRTMLCDKRTCGIEAAKDLNAA